MKQKLSVCIITKNEATHLTACLSTLSFVDQVIIIDDYSTDTTVDIAKRYGATVYNRHLGNNFSKQRNFGLSKASNEWVLFVDADEIVSEELASEIQATLENPQCVGYKLKRSDTFLGTQLKHGETQSVQLLRLAKKEAGQWKRPVHETWHITGPVGVLKSPLFHTGHQNLSTMITKINRYTDLETEYRKQKGDNFSWFEILVYPPAKFVSNYVIKRGFMDGFPGFVMAFMMSLHSFMIRVKLYETS